MTIRELCEKDVVTQTPDGKYSLGLRLFGLLGRDESLTIPWQEIETIGADAILVHTALPEAPPQPEKPAFWRKLLAKWGT